MIIGIDAKAISKTYTGIAVYVHEMINWFCIIAPENEYVLFRFCDAKGMEKL